MVHACIFRACILSYLCEMQYFPHTRYWTFGSCSHSSSRDKTSKAERINSGNQQGHENSEEWEAQLMRRRLFVNGVLCDSAANGESTQCAERLACETPSNNPRWGGSCTWKEGISLGTKLSKDFWNSIPQLQWKRVTIETTSKKGPAPYSIAERILQLYVLSKYRLDSAEMGVTGNQWNILVRTKILNHCPALQTTSKPSCCLQQ